MSSRVARDASMFAALAALSAANLIGTAIAPVLLRHDPLVVAGLSPRPVFLVAAAHHGALWIVAVVAAVRLFVADPLNHAIGARLGAVVAHRSARSRRALARAQRLVVALGPLAVVLRPSGTVMLAAGAAGMRRVQAIAAAAAGTALQVVALCAVVTGWSPVTVVIAGSALLTGVGAALAVRRLVPPLAPRMVLA
ncbi:MAG TPA: hypothetical protein VHD87_15160 [Acidimicrobiales bacterium]|nr:hypothetical protein [Acidimicrobiales bacterium]